jgi:hypothetical protein
MNEKYTEDIINGVLPDQESFTKDEMREIALNVVSWAVLQVEHAWSEMKHDDIPELVANCEYKTPEEAISDVQEGFDDEVYNLIEFMTHHFD